MRWNVWLGWLAVGSAGVMAACLFSAPPSDLPVPPPTRPAIIVTSASPPLDQPVASLPQTFRVAVDAEPLEPLQWSVWTDYGVDPFVTIPPATSPAGSAERKIEFTIDSILFPQQCHKIWLFVAYHTLTIGPYPANNDEDHVVWNYEPGGAYAGCAVFEGGVPDASVPDANDGASE